MPAPTATGLAWWKSSFSGNSGNSGNCVEVAVLPARGVAVRDTKDRAREPHHYSGCAWRAFVAGVRAGEFGA